MSRGEISRLAALVAVRACFLLVEKFFKEEVRRGREVPLILHPPSRGLVDRVEVGKEVVVVRVHVLGSPALVISLMHSSEVAQETLARRMGNP